MIHTPVFNGAGHYCPRCNVSWDQGEPMPPDCLPTAVGAGTQPVGPGEVLRIPDTPEMLTYVEAVSAWSGTAGYFIPAADRDRPKAQIGGTHYQGLTMQPAAFAMFNQLDFCAASILKYVSRHRAKNGVEDLRKALHFVEIREAHLPAFYEPADVVVSMSIYVQLNKISTEDAEVLYRLEAYYNAANMASMRVGALRLTETLNNLIAIEESLLTRA